MGQIRSNFVVLLLFLLAGCVVARTQPKPALTDMGELIIYLQPLPQEAQRLRFAVEGIYALPTDGSEIPLSLSVHELRGVDLTGRQKLLATGTLPPGSFRGLSIRVKDAFVQSQEGETALLVPEEPVDVQQVFEIGRGKAFDPVSHLEPFEGRHLGYSFHPRVLPGKTGTDTHKSHRLREQFRFKPSFSLRQTNHESGK